MIMNNGILQKLAHVKKNCKKTVKTRKFWGIKIKAPKRHKFKSRIASRNEHKTEFQKQKCTISERTGSWYE